MEKSQPSSNSLFLRKCKTPSLSEYPVLYPTDTNFCLKSFKNSVNFNPEKSPCKNTWYQDVKSTFIRNRKLLDHPCITPKCCSVIYNIVMDRQKLKKLKKYGLTRPVRTLAHQLKLGESKKCSSENEVKKVKPTCFPEFFKEPKFSSDEEEADGHECCESGSMSECSDETKTNTHKTMRKDFQSLLHDPEGICMDTVKREIIKHKLGRDFPLKLKKVF